MRLPPPHLDNVFSLRNAFILHNSFALIAATMSNFVYCVIFCAWNFGYVFSQEKSEIVNVTYNRKQNPEGLEWVAAVTQSRGFAVDGVSKPCLEALEQYWIGLDEGDPLAMRVYDSNGRYSSMFFGGNDYWLGSKMLCNELKVANVTFRIAKLRVTIPKNPPQGRIIYMGLCQPGTCSTNDSERLLTAWSHGPNRTENNSTRIEVLHVRLVPGEYSVLKDARFIILSATIAVVSILVIAASIYDKVIESGYRSYGLENGKRTAEGAENQKHQTGENNNGYVPEEESNRNSKLNDMSLTEVKHQGENTQHSSPKTANLKRSIAEECLLAFSMTRNAKQILNFESKGESLNSIHGLRVFSVIWVILVHTYLQLFAVGGNKIVKEVTERTFMFRTIGNATFSVNTFFFISGVLLTYLYNKKPQEKSVFSKDIQEFGFLVSYRFLRLTPVYMLVVGFVQTSMAYIRSNSVFEPNILDDKNCEIYWWRNLAYVNNLYPRTEMCMLWSWYLAADTQFFVLGILLLIVGKSRFKLAVGTMSAILIGAWSTTAFIAYTNNYQAKLSEPFGLFDELYDKPWTRIGPYLVGMAAGYFLKKCSDFKIPRVAVWIGWTISCALLLSLVYGLGAGLNAPTSTAYASLGHTAWGVCLAWIVIACQRGHGGLVNSILGCKIFFPLSRMTFCAYLVHPVIMVLTTYVMDGSFHFHNGMVVIVFLGNTVASFFLSFLLSLGFESPVVRLIKLAFK